MKIQAVIASYNENGKNDKFSVNKGNFLDNNKLFLNDSKFYSHGNFLDNYFGNSNMRMANANNIEISYIFFSNNLLDFSIIS